LDGNLEAIESIKNKLELLLDVETDSRELKNKNIQVPVLDNSSSKIKEKPNSHGSCPATIPLGGSKADFTMNKFYSEWDFVDVDGGVWKQGWDIKTNDQEWKETKLKVILMPHSHNDPGWVKTLDVYYQGQTKKILNTIVDNLIGHSNRKFVWAETIFLDLW